MFPYKMQHLHPPRNPRKASQLQRPGADVDVRQQPVGNDVDGDVHPCRPMRPGLPRRSSRLPDHRLPDVQSRRRVAVLERRRVGVFHRHVRRQRHGRFGSWLRDGPGERNSIHLDYWILDFKHGECQDDDQYC